MSYPAYPVWTGRYELSYHKDRNSEIEQLHMRQTNFKKLIGKSLTIDSLKAKNFKWIISNRKSICLAKIGCVAH